MANRSLFPAFVEVHERHLTDESADRIAGLNELTSDITSRGVKSGLAVTVNGTTSTLIDVAVGSAYAPNGEYMELINPQVGLSLADNTLGVVNYVLLVYDEVASQPEAHETDGTTRMTKAVVSPRVAVLTAAQYAALPPTAAVLAQDAKDRAALVALVTGTGGALTGASIQLSTAYQDVLQITQPTNITGIDIINIDSTTPVGVGVLTYTFATKRVTWQSPGDASAGTFVTLTTSGDYTVTSLSGHTLVLSVVYSILPPANATDNITITNIYNNTIQRFSAQDAQHRALLGTGVPTPTNPHGLTLNDLSPGARGALEEHQDVMHANGIISESNANLLNVTVNTGPAPDTLSVADFVSGDLVYINGLRISSLLSSTTITFGDGVAETATYTIYLTQDGTLSKTLLSNFATGSLYLYNIMQVLDVYGIVGTLTMTWTNTGLISLNGGPTIAAPSSDTVMRVYNVDRVGYVDLFVKGSSTPGTTRTADIVFYAPPNLDENFPLANVPWSGSATGFLGYGFGAANSPNRVFDKRQRGTLEQNDTREDAGMINAGLMESELLGDGIIVRSKTQSGATDGVVTVAAAYADQFSASTAASYTTVVNGGVAFLGGRRFEVATAILSSMSNGSNQIYVDPNGTILSSTGSWTSIISTYYGRPIIRLYEITIFAGNETGRLDLREYVGQKRDVAMGVVGLDVNKRATLQSATAGVESLHVMPNGIGPAIKIDTLSTTNAIGLDVTAGLSATTGIRVNTVAGSIGINANDGGAGSIGLYSYADSGGVPIQVLNLHNDPGDYGITVSTSNGRAINLDGGVGEAIHAVNNASTRTAYIANSGTGGGIVLVTDSGIGTSITTNDSSCVSAANASSSPTFGAANTGTGLVFNAVATGNAAIGVSSAIPTATTVMSNVISAGNMIRAHLYISNLNNLSLATAANHGFNLNASPGLVTAHAVAHSRLQIGFATAFASTHYTPIVVIHAAPGAVAATSTPKFEISNKTTSQLDIDFYEDVSTTAVDMSLGNWGISVLIVGFGGN